LHALGAFRRSARDRDDEIRNDDRPHRNEPSVPSLPRGKVRDVYDFGDQLLFVATDRISAFDVVLDPGFPTRDES